MRALIIFIKDIPDAWLKKKSAKPVREVHSNSLVFKIQHFRQLSLTLLPQKRPTNRIIKLLNVKMRCTARIYSMPAHLHSIMLTSSKSS